MSREHLISDTGYRPVIIDSNFAMLLTMAEIVVSNCPSGEIVVYYLKQLRLINFLISSYIKEAWNNSLGRQ